MLTAFSLLYLLGLVVAAPTVIEPRQQSRQVNVQFSVPGSQFQSFENPQTLEQYAQAKGVTYKLNYTQLSQGVARIDKYFSDKASSAPSSTQSNQQFVVLDDSPIKTHTHSTTLKGGPSYTNVSCSANATYVDVLSFSDGNAATAGGAIQKTITSSSTASSGAANSTDHVTGTSSTVQIDISSMVNAAQDSRVVNGGQQDALAAGSCSASANGASARSSIATTFTVPINVTGSNSVGSVALSFCEAGVNAKSGASGTSTGGTQAALTSGGVQAVVSCNGQNTKNSAPQINFTVGLKGTYADGVGFKGTLTVERVASASVSCS